MAQVVFLLFLLVLICHLPFSFPQSEMRDPGSRNVERPLRLPVLGESHASIHDLAHDAGYVKIKHSIEGKFFFGHHCYTPYFVKLKFVLRSE